MYHTIYCLVILNRFFIMCEPISVYMYIHNLLYFIQVAFTKIFVKHYNRISKMLAKSTDSDTLSNRVVHVSVQLFSNEDLAYEMTKNHDLLKIMITSLHAMMITIAHNSTLQCKLTIFFYLFAKEYF